MGQGGVAHPGAFVPGLHARRQEGTSVWVVRSDQIVASDPGEKASYFDPMEDKVYRHPTFYALPDEVNHM